MNFFKGVTFLTGETTILLTFSVFWGCWVEDLAFAVVTDGFDTSVVLEEVEVEVVVVEDGEVVVVAVLTGSEATVTVLVFSTCGSHHLLQKKKNNFYRRILFLVKEKRRFDLIPRYFVFKVGVSWIKIGFFDSPFIQSCDINAGWWDRVGGKRSSWNSNLFFLGTDLVVRNEVFFLRISQSVWLSANANLGRKPGSLNRW